MEENIVNFDDRVPLGYLDAALRTLGHTTSVVFTNIARSRSPRRVVRRDGSVSLRSDIGLFADRQRHVLGDHVAFVG
jgi:hypothetical protein